MTAVALKKARSRGAGVISRERETKRSKFSSHLMEAKHKDNKLM